MTKQAMTWVLPLALLAASAGCGSDDGAAAGETGETGDGDGDGDPGDGDGDSGDGDGDGDEPEPAACTPSPNWSHEAITPSSPGNIQALAVAEDDTLHLLRVVGNLPYYRQRPPGEAWTAEEQAPNDLGWDFFLAIRMRVQQGELAAVAEGAGGVLTRSPEGNWAVDGPAALAAGPGAPALDFTNDGTLHVANGLGQLQVPFYGRRPAGGEFESVDMPADMSGGETTSVTVIDGDVVVCTVLYPNVGCASSADGFASVTTVYGSNISRVAIDGRWMLTAAVSLGYVTDLVAHHYDAGQWTPVGNASSPGFLGLLDIDTDPLGNLHATGTLLFEPTEPVWNVRYFGFTPEGGVVSEWVGCDYNSTDVVGLSDGTPLVSYASQLTGELGIATRQ